MAFDVAIEGIRELAQSGPVAEFFRNLFDPEVFDMKAAAADGVGATGAESGDTYEVAEVELEPLTAPEDWRGNGMFEAGPRGYLEYLRYSIEEYKQVALASQDQLIFVREDSGEEWTTHKNFMRNYEIIMKQINGELRPFHKHDPHILKDLYQSVNGLREEAEFIQKPIRDVV